MDMEFCILCQPLALNYDLEPFNTLHSLDLKIPQQAFPKRLFLPIFYKQQFIVSYI